MKNNSNNSPQTSEEDAPHFLKEPRWTEERLQYDLFREALHHPLVTSRGIPELLNHCGPLFKKRRAFRPRAPAHRRCGHWRVEGKIGKREAPRSVRAAPTAVWSGARDGPD